MLVYPRWLVIEQVAELRSTPNAARATSQVYNSTEFLMLKNHKRRKSFECITEREVLSAISYLDPDLESRRTRRDAGTAWGTCIVLLTVVTGVMTYICLYFSRL
jgi:hypothetical protein